MRQSTIIRQEQIKQSVLDIIHEDGINKVSIKNLAKRTGISEGAIFRHFSSKSEIIYSVIKDVQNNFIGNLRHVIRSKYNCHEKLKLFIEETINYLTDNKGVTMLMLAEATQNTDNQIKETLLNIFNSQKEYFEFIISEGIKKNSWSPELSLQEISDFYMGIPISLNVEIILKRETINKKTYTNKILKTLLKLLS